METPFFGIKKRLDDSQKTRAGKNIEAKKHDASRPYRGEIKKSPEDLRLLEFANALIQEECGKLGIQEVSLISPGRIHFLDPDQYDLLEKDGSLGTHNRQRGDEVLIRYEKYRGRVHLLRVVMHEMLHVVSKARYAVKTDTRGRIMKIESTRIGYLNINQSFPSVEHFRYLNEAVVEEMVQELIKNNISRINRAFSITGRERNLASESYLFPRKILRIIVKKIADAKSESQKEVWKRFKRGLITGEMMHLRDVVRTFGPLGIRVLAVLEETPYPEGVLPEDERRAIQARADAIKLFFETEDSSVRKESAKIAGVQLPKARRKRSGEMDI